VALGRGSDSNGHSRKTTRSKASQLLTKVNIASELELRTRLARHTERIQAQERDRLLSAIARDTGEQTIDCIAAIKELTRWTVDIWSAVRLRGESLLSWRSPPPVNEQALGGANQILM
jgi:hypothetical protein